MRPRRDDGRPWVSWVTSEAKADGGTDAGWFASGTRAPASIQATGFWAAIVRTGAVCAGANLDQAHIVGRGNLALGALGVTMRGCLGVPNEMFGFAPMLLQQCLIRNPMRFVEVMAPVIHHSGMYPKATREGVSIVHYGLLFLDRDGKGWTKAEKDAAHLWVECCSRLLRDQTMDAAQVEFARRALPLLLEPMTAAVIRWPSSGVDLWWSYTREQQLVWALAFLLMMRNREAGTILIEHAASLVSPHEESFAVTLLAELDRLIQAGNPIRSWYEDALRELTALLGAMPAGPPDEGESP